MHTDESLRVPSSCLSRMLTYSASFAVATVMFSTTTLLAVQMVYVKQLPVVIAVGFFLIFGFLDGKVYRTLLPLRCFICF